MALHSLVMICRTMLLKCDALRELLQFLQFKKLEKHSLKPCNFTKSNTPP